jgi:hypothetical protein
MAKKDAQPDAEPKTYPSQGVPTKVDRRVLPLLNILKAWSGIKQYRWIMLLVCQEVRSHPELVAALPPDLKENLEGLEYDLVPDLALYARWRDQSEADRKGKKKT